MEFFEKKFVYFMWDESLKGKECFYDDDIEELKKSVNDDNTDFKAVLEPNTVGYPFRSIAHGRSCCSWRFAYYDPNYECKVAYSMGAQIQHRQKGTNAWFDGIPNWDLGYEYRIKPVTYYVGIGTAKTLAYSSIITSFKHIYASFPSEQAAKHWIFTHRKFVPVMRAFEKGLTIEYKHEASDWIIATTPSWDIKLRYRVWPGHAYIKHEEHTKRRMTNRELAKWLAEGKGQVLDTADKFVRIIYHYKDGDNVSCRRALKIRAWNETEWHEPEVEEHKEEVL